MQSLATVKRFVPATLAVTAVALGCWSARGNGQGPTPPRAKGYASYVEIPGASRVGSDTCATCHKQNSKNFQHAFHMQQGLECEDCHGNGSLHVEGGGDITKILSFTKRPVSSANGVCLGCHIRSEEVRHWLNGPHAANHVRCVDCHQVHAHGLRAANEGRVSFDTSTRAAYLAGSVSPETEVIVRPAALTNEACLKCHQTQGAQLSMPYHHPLREGKISCVDCHNPHGGPTGSNLRTSTVNQLCLGCHAQYRGPFTYQHPPVTENCLTCHAPHGSPNTNLLIVSQPALCLQCHGGHHNGASRPIPDRCTNCHGSIHGTDVATPSGGSTFIDKGSCGVPSEPAGAGACGSLSAASSFHGAIPGTSAQRSVHSRMPTFGMGAANGILGMLSSFTLLSGGPMSAGGSNPATGSAGNSSSPAEVAEEGAASSFSSITPAVYRFLDGSGYLGRVGEYDSLEQSAGADGVIAHVSPENHLTLVSRANVVTGKDYSAASQLTVGQWLRAEFDLRSFVQQQDHYTFYAFPYLDLPPGTPAPCVPNVTCVDATTENIPSQSVFGVTRRLGNANAQLKVPKLPVHLFVKGTWQARSGVTQLGYLDQNATPAVFVPNSSPPPAQLNSTCGQQCHYTSQFQNVNYTTRSVAGGADVDLGSVRLTWLHKFSSFNDRLVFPIGTYTGPFTTANQGYPTQVVTPPSGPAPAAVPAGNYYLDIPSPNQSSSDSLSLNWTASPKLTFNGQTSYIRLRNEFTNNPQNIFDADTTLTWRPLDRLRAIVDYHQQNLINDFTPYYSLYGNISYHRHWEGLRLDYELPRGFDAEVNYNRSGITRSNASLWPQIYSVDNIALDLTLLHVVPSSTSNTAGIALRYHDQGRWSARAGNEWTGTDNPGYLTVPQSSNRTFADIWFTPTPNLVFSNDLSVIVQNAFPSIPLLRSDGTGLQGNFQRRNRFYFETLSSTLRLSPEWNLGLGYSYQQNNLNTYMAFQNDPGPGYVVNEPNVPYKQITQAYWGDTTYTLRQRLGLNLRLIYNSSRSGMRPDVNPADAALLGNQSLIAAGTFDPSGLFAPSLANVQFASTQISEVVVPQWIGQSKAYYRFPNKFEGGLVFYYGSYRDQWNPNLNGVLRTFTLYVGRSW